MVRQKKQIRMTLNFKSEQTLILIQNLTKEESISNEVSPSKIIIDNALEALLPDIELNSARHYAEEIYQNHIGISGLLSQCFWDNAAGEDSKVIHQNLKPLVQFLYKLANEWNLTADLNDSTQELFISFFDTLTNYCNKNQALSETDQHKLTEFLNSYSYTESTPLYFSKVPINELLAFILDNWASIGEINPTYRLLSALVSITYGFRDRIKKLPSGKESKKWKEKDPIKNNETVLMSFENDAITARKEVIAIYTQIEKEWE